MTNSIPVRVPQKQELVPYRWEVLIVVWRVAINFAPVAPRLVCFGWARLLGGLREYTSVGGGPIVGLSAACVLGGPGPGDLWAGHRAKIRGSWNFSLVLTSPRRRELQSSTCIYGCRGYVEDIETCEIVYSYER